MVNRFNIVPCLNILCTVEMLVIQPNTSWQFTVVGNSADTVIVTSMLCVLAFGAGYCSKAGSNQNWQSEVSVCLIASNISQEGPGWYNEDLIKLW